MSRFDQHCGVLMMDVCDSKLSTDTTLVSKYPKRIVPFSGTDLYYTLAHWFKLSWCQWTSKSKPQNWAGHSTL